MQAYVLGEEDDIEDLKDEVTSDITSVLGRVNKSGEGVCVQASTLGSLEALLEFLKVCVQSLVQSTAYEYEDCLCRLGMEWRGGA